MALSVGTTPTIPAIDASPPREPDAGFQAARARTADLIERAVRDDERQPLATKNPAEVKRAVSSASDKIEASLAEKQAANRPQLPGEGDPGVRVDISV